MAKKAPTQPSAGESPRASALHLRYDALVRQGRIQDDKAQRAVLDGLEALIRSLGEQQPERAIGGLFKKQPEAKTPKSLYLWGKVGRGKSMLMDMFFQTVPAEKKRRVHFHAFMQEVHSRIHQIRRDRKHTKGGADPVMVLAREISEATSLLCFDELQATDVADATLLYRLFSGLFEAGVVVVSTSNHPPASLYTGGVQRERFNKFIHLIEERMRVMPVSGPHDYRQTQMQAMQQTYYFPLGVKADAFISGAIARLCANTQPHRESIAVHGRVLPFDLYDNSVGRFTFGDLCEGALGAADYLALAARLDTVILTGIPALPPEKRNEAKRFVTLIDALYEHRVKLLCTAAVPPEKIYGEGDGAFEFGRTVSRLKEMQSAQWFQDA